MEAILRKVVQHESEYLFHQACMKVDTSDSISMKAETHGRGLHESEYLFGRGQESEYL